MANPRLPSPTVFGTDDGSVVKALWDAFVTALSYLVVSVVLLILLATVIGLVLVKVIHIATGRGSVMTDNDDHET